MKKIVHLFLPVLWACLWSLGLGQSADLFLSHLSADSAAPLFTTYTAAMSRSEFTLDEGFRLCYDNPTGGIDLLTDKAGNWCLAFKKDGQYVYQMEQMYRSPVVTVSYPDLVRYHYFPYQDLKVQITFLVYNSKLALQDLQLTNMGNKTIDFTMFSFLKNDYRVFDHVRFDTTKNAILFTHEELPDGWTLAHKIPYVATVYDFFLSSEPVDFLKSFREYRWGNVQIPREVYLKKKQKYLVWGRFRFGQRKSDSKMEDTPEMFVFLNGHPDTVLTETAPRWGNVERNVSPWGYGIELGNFPSLRFGDTFTIRLVYAHKNLVARIQGRVADLMKNNTWHADAVFEKETLPSPPAHFRKDVWGNGTEIRLYWDRKPGMRYNVYRRDYRRGGYYVLLAKGSRHAFFTDKNIAEDKIYGYFVTATDSLNRMSAPTKELTNIFGSDFLTDMKYPDQIMTDARDFVRVVSLQKRIRLQPGESRHLRIIRGFARDEKKRKELMQKVKKLLKIRLKSFIKADEAILSAAPRLKTKNKDLQMLYWSAFNMMRQVFLPPEGQCGFNYYVFSREPTWGWGHGGQVFHESLAMMAYDLLDAQSAMNSQRVFRERQHADGYINYRTGPYLNEIIEYHGEKTTSAPWYAWENWQVYTVSHDKKFLKEMYASSVKFYHYIVAHRDKDGDGLCEWGGHAVLESVRDGEVVIWDKVGWPANFEALDLNCMLVMEAKSLAKMAGELGLKKQAQDWKSKAEQRARLINKTFWDEETGFYYHADKKDNDFTFKSKNDLKRQEIIGFLPLWAGIATPQQAQKLVHTLTDTAKFWRKYGVPSLAADDPYYNPRGYWNGPVWVQWNYLIEQGLLHYGYGKLAEELVNRVAANMIAVLRKNHDLWEFYSPDSHWAGYHRTYIWAGIINRMLLDVYGADTLQQRPSSK